MPLKDPQKRKEYARLSMAILKAKREKKDVTKLLEKRKKLTQTKPKTDLISKQILKKISTLELLNELKKRVKKEI
jgi:hypothetical protein